MLNPLQLSQVERLLPTKNSTAFALPSESIKCLKFFTKNSHLLVLNLNELVVTKVKDFIIYNQLRFQYCYCIPTVQSLHLTLNNPYLKLTAPLLVNPEQTTTVISFTQVAKLLKFGHPCLQCKNTNAQLLSQCYF